MNLFRKIIILSFIVITCAFSQWIDLSSDKESTYSIELLEDNPQGTIFKMNLPGYYLKTQVIEGKNYTILDVPKTTKIMEMGYPELPRINESIVIPDESKMNYEILDVEYDTTFVNPIISSKGDLLRSMDPQEIPYSFEDVYCNDIYWPEQLVEFSSPFILRDIRGITVRINLFRYNAVKKCLITCKHLVIRVYEDGMDDININKGNKKNIAFESIQKRMFLNYDKKKENTLNKASYDDIPEEGEMLIIVADDYYDNVIPLRDWRTRTGNRAIVVKCSDIGDAEDIKDYISTYYSYVLLVGEGNDSDFPSKSVPYYYTNSEPDVAKDPMYALQEEGNDFPVLFVSRISAENASQVNNQINRIINYETVPVSGNWFEMATGIADTDPKKNPSDVESCNILRTILLGYGYNTVDQLYNITSSASITNAINQGRSLVNYIGHGATEKWDLNNIDFTVTDVQNLTNYYKLPFIIASACFVGNFNDQISPTCFAESWLRSGAEQNPIGAIGFYGSSTSQAFTAPVIAQTEAMNLLCSDEKITIGGLCYCGACAMIEDGNLNAKQTFNTWHLFGDAATRLWTKTPMNFSSVSVDVNGNVILINTGIDGTAFTISSTNNGYTMWDYFCDSSYDYWYFSTSGHPVYISATKQNYIPYLAITGGTINSDEYWCGNMDILGDVTISSGNTLTIMEGTTLNFKNNSSLIVNGKLIAEGTETKKITFKGKSGNNWGNVRLYGDNNTLEYCVFDGGSNNLYLNGSSENTIDYCEFRNAQNTGLQLYSSYASITNSYFHDNSENGIDINYSSPLLLNNTIEDNNNNGVVCIGYSEPDFVKYDQDGYNIIRDNDNDGLISCYYSDVMLGVCTWQSFGKNSLYNNGHYDLMSYSHSDAYARYNWWGTSNPSSSQFYCDFTSTLYRDNHLSSFPGGGSPLSKSIAGDINDPASELTDNNKNIVEGKYNLALYTRHTKRENETAIGLFKEIINNYPETVYANKSLLQLYHIYEKNNVAGLKILLKNNKDRDTSSRLKGLAYELLISNYLKEHNYDEAIKLCNEVINLLPNTDSEASVLGMLVNLYNNQLRDNKIASDYLDILEEKYPNHIFTLLAQEETGVKVNWATMEKALSEEDAGDSYDLIIPKIYKLRAAYPNPFNPSTKLEFALPVQSDVKCSIYDVRGNLVKEYSYNQNAGTHHILWDASNISSGIYLIRFVAEASDGSETFVDYQKVTLLK